MIPAIAAATQAVRNHQDCHSSGSTSKARTDSLVVQTPSGLLATTRKRYGLGGRLHHLQLHVHCRNFCVADDFFQLGHSKSPCLQPCGLFCISLIESVRSSEITCITICSTLQLTLSGCPPIPRTGY